MTKIDWVINDDGTQGKTWNPCVGCFPAGPGCDNCYARTFAERWRGVHGHPYEQGFDLRLWPARLAMPTRTRKPTTWFVNSMSDLFWSKVPTDFVDRVFGVMESQACEKHTFQVLTKRASRMRDYLAARWPNGGPSNIWCGVTVECRASLKKVDALRATPAAVRFLSFEPLLEDLGAIDLSGISWIIVGGESGPKFRPMDPAWARSIRDQCARAGVPFFYKQGSGRLPVDRGKQLDGVTYHQCPRVESAQTAQPSLF